MKDNPNHRLFGMKFVSLVAERFSGGKRAPAKMVKSIHASPHPGRTIHPQTFAA